MLRAGRSHRPGRSVGRRGHRRQRAQLALLAVFGLAVALLSPAVAHADPTNPSDAEIAAAQAQRAADVAALGALTGQLAAIDAEITTQQQALDDAIAKYEKTTDDLAAAVEVTATKAAELTDARTAVDKARAAAQAQLRRTFMQRNEGGPGELIVSTNPNSAIAASDYHRYLLTRQQYAFDELARLRVIASNSEAAAKTAESRQRDLQETAAQQRDAVLAGLRAFQARKVELAAKRDALNQQAAVTFGRLNNLLEQRAAYDAWQAQQAAAAAAEAARQAALAKQRQSTTTATTATATAAPRPVLPPATGGTWGSPMAPGTYSISSCFCARWGTFHYGVDFAAPLGTPMYAVGAGTVVAAGPAQGFGNWVVIDHGTGEFSIYGHMRTFIVTRGQHVDRGQNIAFVGSEGESTGAHLHLEIRLGGISGRAVDPQVWLAQRGVYV